MRRYSVVICTDGSSANGATSFVDRARIDQRLVALHVDDDVAVERRGDFGEPIGAGLVCRLASAAPCRRTRATRVAMRRSSVATITRDTHRRRRGAAIDVLDHRPAVDVGERLAGESCRGESGGDDGDDVERRSGIDSQNQSMQGARRIIAQPANARATIARRTHDEPEAHGDDRASSAARSRRGSRRAATSSIARRSPIVAAASTRRSKRAAPRSPAKSRGCTSGCVRRDAASARRAICSVSRAPSPRRRRAAPAPRRRSPKPPPARAAAAVAEARRHRRRRGADGPRAHRDHLRRRDSCSS